MSESPDDNPSPDIQQSLSHAPSEGGLSDEQAVVEAAKRIVSGEVESDPTREAVMDQVKGAYSAYHTMIGVLDRADLRAINQEYFEAALDGWLTKDKLEYMQSERKAEPGLDFDLVAVPNVLIDHNELEALGGDLAERQHDERFHMTVFDGLYDKYTPEQLSGTNPQNGEAVSFILIPNKPDEQLHGTLADQRAALEKMKAEHDFLDVPSPFQAVGHWYSLRSRLLAEGRSLTMVGLDTEEATDIVHFDLPEQPIGVMHFVPRTLVGPYGSPLLQGSIAASEEGPQFTVSQSRVGIV